MAKSAWRTGENEDFMKKEVIVDRCAFYISLHTTSYGAVRATISCLIYEASLVKVKDFLWLPVLIDIFKRSGY